MIENIILKVLKQDEELAALTCGRIYPDVAQTETLPCVVMSADEPTSPISEPWAYTQNISFEIYAKTIKQAQNIRDRFYEILQKYDEFFFADLQRSGIIIRECHAVYASVSNHSRWKRSKRKKRPSALIFTIQNAPKRAQRRKYGR